MKRNLLFILLFIITITCSLAASDSIDFSIRFYEKRIYYVGDIPVRLEVVITNNSSETYRFKMANTRLFNLDFEITTPTNLMLNHSKEFTIAKHANQPVLFREISLEPGERYGIVITLSDFIQIDKPGLFSIQALFFPELNLNSKVRPLKSNVLACNIRPAVVFAEEKAMIEAETGKLIERKVMPPDEVVDYMLKARQKSQWEKFFLYMDIESLYNRMPARARRFKQMSEEKRKTELKVFKEQLKQEKTDQDILVIPASFEILKTTYTPFEATVIVREKFQYRDYVEVKRYTYYLNRRDKIWTISNYEVQNLGTE